MDESAASVKRTRFPWVVALLCAASLGAAAWTWMRYSYAWEVTPTDAYERGMKGRFVSIRGIVVELEGWEGARHPALTERRTDSAERELWGAVLLLGLATEPQKGTEIGVKGRLVRSYLLNHPYWTGVELYYLAVDTTASRFTWHSITGLVVGAMGMFVFVMYLRTWLKERNAPPQA